MEKLQRNVVGIIGLGLLGGSLAKALKKYTNYEVIGYARRKSVCEEALSSGAVSEACTEAKEVAAKSDILVLALPPDTNAEIFKSLARYLKPGTLVTDVASTKGKMVKTIYEYLPKNCFFVSTHPMAGSEQGGFGQATDSLFMKATWIVLEDKDNSAFNYRDAELLMEMGKNIGSIVEVVPLAMHDRLVASISHIPHLAATLVAVLAGESENSKLAYRLTAGGFRDVTRVAGGNPAMWREILRGNAQEVDILLAKMEVKIKELRKILQSEVNEGDAALETYLQQAHDYREEYRQIKESQRDIRNR